MAAKKDYSPYWRGFERFQENAEYGFPLIRTRIGEFTGRQILEANDYYHLVAWAKSRKEGFIPKQRFIRCGIVIHADKDEPNSAKKRFDQILRFKDDIDTEFGSNYRLDWDRKITRKECQIILWNEADSNNKKDRPRQYKWLAERLELLYRTFPFYLNTVELGIDD